MESIPDTKNTNFFGQVKFQISRDWQAYGTALYSRDENHYIIQPVPLSSVVFYGVNGDIPATVTVSPGQPFYPTAAAIAAGVNGQVLDVRYRAVLSGNRDTTDTNDGYQLVGGVKGSIGTWDMDFAYNYADGKVKDVLNGGFPLYSHVLPILNNGSVNLFGPNTDAVMQAVQAANFNGETFHGEASTGAFTAQASSEIWQMANGPLALALGAEYRKEKFDQFYNPVLRTGDVSGFGGAFNDTHASRDDTALYAELNIPLAEDPGSQHRDPHGQLQRFRPHQQSEGVAALPAEQGAAPARFVRHGLPGAVALPDVRAAGCEPDRAGHLRPGPMPRDARHGPRLQHAVHDDQCGGNPHLKPEQSENVTAGFVFEPTNQLSLSADYFKIRLRDVITYGHPVPDDPGRPGPSTETW